MMLLMVMRTWIGNKGGGKFVLTFGRSNIAELLTLPTPVSCKFATPGESFHILSAECVMNSSDLPPAPLTFQHLMFLAIVENVLQTRH